MLGLFSVQDRIAVVTGASSGIGLAIGQVLAQFGAKVVLIARRTELLEQESQKIESTGGAAKWVGIDLLDRSQLAESYDRVLSCFGAPEIVVNAAGINLREPTEKISWNSWDKTVQLNLTVPFFFSRQFVRIMKKQGRGKIINVASLQSMRAFKNGIAYGASKGGVSQLTRAMAEAWSAHGIMCNAIAPGFFPTSLTAPVFESEKTEMKMAEATAIGRNGRMEDLHGPILFLASPASDYVTGQILFVDGGFTAK